MHFGYTFIEAMFKTGFEIIIVLMNMSRDKPDQLNEANNIFGWKIFERIF